MNTQFPGFRSFFRFLHHFVLAKLASSSIRVDDVSDPEAGLRRRGCQGDHEKPASYSLKVVIVCIIGSAHLPPCLQYFHGGILYKIYAQ